MNETKQFELPLAIVDGEPLHQFPDGLYVPTEALTVQLNDFEGPLDLLLFLVRKDKLDIRQLPIANIAEQYAQFVAMMLSEDGLFAIELAADYLWMAGYLAEVKSRLLLPIPELDENDDEIDPRQALADMLLLYEAYQQGAQWLDQCQWVDRDIQLPEFRPGHELLHSGKTPSIDLDGLLMAFERILQRQQLIKPHEIAPMETIELEDKLPFVLNRLATQAQASFLELCHLPEGKLGFVMTFMAVLTLLKNQQIQLITPDNLSPSTHWELTQGDIWLALVST